MTVVFRVPINAAQGRDEMLSGTTPTTGVSTNDGLCLDVFNQLINFRGCRFV